MTAGESVSGEREEWSREVDPAGVTLPVRVSFLSISLQ